jgi:hypothetical protein
MTMMAREREINPPLADLVITQFKAPLIFNRFYESKFFNSAALKERIWKGPLPSILQ